MDPLVTTGLYVGTVSLEEGFRDLVAEGFAKFCRLALASVLVSPEVDVLSPMVELSFDDVHGVSRTDGRNRF